MALEKQIFVDKVEVTGDFRHVQVRTATRIVEDGQIISQSYHRHVVSPLDNCSGECPEVQAIVAAVHTDEVKATYQAHLDAQQSEIAPVDPE